MPTEAVTIDAHGTLVVLRDPVAELQRALAERGVRRDENTVRRAFETEVAFYAPRSHEGRDRESLAALRAECARVFTAAADTDLDDFADAFTAAISFEELPGARAACTALRDAGLSLAVVSNWDIGLREHLALLGLETAVDAIVTSAEVGARKPAPDVFLEALARLGSAAERAVHVGDDASDEAGAAAAGMRFERAPLDEAARRILA
jgi:HAD superfamily hydrolase (TIGR01509 family)